MSQSVEQNSLCWGVTSTLFKCFCFRPIVIVWMPVWNWSTVEELWVPPRQSLVCAPSAVCETGFKTKILIQTKKIMKTSRGFLSFLTNGDLNKIWLKRQKDAAWACQRITYWTCSTFRDKLHSGQPKHLTVHLGKWSRWWYLLSAQRLMGSLQATWLSPMHSTYPK